MSIRLLSSIDVLAGDANIRLPNLRFSWKGYDENPDNYWDKLEGQQENTQSIAPYILNDNIKEVIKLAQILGRPVLIKGEPGSGKSQLAKALAYEWYKDEPLGYQSKFFEWHIKSTSKAADGLYTFDHLARLRDTQSADISDQKRAQNRKNYREFGPLAKAMLVSRATAPAVLLIDEIDKADVDFPNDLLLELDEKRFFIPDTNEALAAKASPLILITSNEERDLPQAFLRRCLFLYLQFPKGQQLNDIIAHQFPNFWQESSEMLETIAQAFRKTKDKLENEPSVTHQISTSNLLELIKAIEKDPERKVEDYETALQYYYPVLLKSYASLISMDKLENS